MRKIIVVLFLCVLGPSLAVADDKDYGPVNVSATSVSGDQVRGPVKVKLIGVNVLQKNVAIGVNVTYPSGPDLTLPFIPKLPGGSGAPAPPAPPAPMALKDILRQTPSPDVRSKFETFVSYLNSYEGNRSDLQAKIQTGIDTVNTANSSVTAFVGSSGLALAADPKGSVLLPQIASIQSTVIGPALAFSWPTAGIATLETNLAELKNNLSALQDDPGWKEWAATASTKTAYDAAVVRVTDLMSLTIALEETNNKSASALADSEMKLQQWNSIMTAIHAGGADSFSRTIDATCSFGFSNNKNSQIEMQTTDRLAPTGTAATKLDIVTVVCSSPFSISAGFGLSSIQERKIGFIQSQNSSAQPISIFGFTAKSSFTPLPLVFLNTRFHEWSDDWAAHFSVGAVVNIQTGAASSTDVEFVAGPSISFRRSLFVTGAFQAGRTQVLTGGFSIGQQVPAGINSAPTESHWSPGFVLAFTYKLK